MLDHVVVDDDVALERDLTDFVDRYGYVVRANKPLQLTRAL